MMWGWLRAAAVRASRLKRSTIPSPMSRSVGARTLIATLRSRARSWARYTVAIPPWPTAVRISYCPRVARRSAASCACAVSGRVSTTDPGGVATVGPDQGRCTGMPVPQRGQKAVPGPRVAPQRDRRRSVRRDDCPVQRRRLRVPVRFIRRAPLLERRLLGIHSRFDERPLGAVNHPGWADGWPQHGDAQDGAYMPVVQRDVERVVDDRAVALDPD